MTETSDIWTGKASSYDRARPTTPPALLDLLTQLIDMPHPALVVDLGSGTGLSTAIWGERAERVIGIEPSADMRQESLRKVEDHCTGYLAHPFEKSPTSPSPPLYLFTWHVKLDKGKSRDILLAIPEKQPQA